MGVGRLRIQRLALLPIGVAAAALSLAACGQTSAPVSRPVTVSHLTPTDGTRVATDSIELTGTVSPRHARVLVAGDQVKIGASGQFSTTVTLQTGTNVIDVIASAPDARPSMSAVRVVRYVLVSVPSVEGDDPRAATAAIKAAGLTPKLESDGNPFSFLVPFSQQVCSQSPQPNTRVSPASTVTLQVGKVCL